MRFLTGSFALLFLFGAAAPAATLHTPAGKINLPPPHSWEQYRKKNPAPPADPDVSWGKANVTYARYNHDKLYCAFYGLKYALMTPAWAMSGHHGLGNVVSNAYRNAQIRQSGQEEIEHCLRLRGYRKFRLTQAQFAHLQSLKHGSKEMERYLYSLASDAAVLERQKP